MPSSPFIASHRLVERTRELRQKPLGFAIAIGAVGAAALVRWAVGEYVTGLPFVTFYPAIILATVVGGLRPGLLALALSATAAWYLFPPGPMTWALDARGLASVAVYLAIGAIDVGFIVLLNMGVETVLTHEHNMRVMIEAAPNGIVMVDERGRIKLINATTERLFGYSRDELLGKYVEVLVPGRVSEMHRMLRTGFMKFPEARPMGVGRYLTGRRKDGSEFPVEIGLSPISHDGAGGVLATVIDISERKRAEEQQHLLFREMRHRTQNLFAVIQSVAQRSLVEGRDVTQAAEIFTGRLHALARAYAVLADSAWEGASLADLIEREFAGFSEHRTVNGCDIMLNPPAVQNFAMIVHELATNAAKHGALSVPEGRVSVEGRIDRGDGRSFFSFVWRETGGPPVCAPSRKGFGSKILLDMARQFSEHVALNYEPQGLHYELCVRLGKIAARPGTAPKPPAAAASPPLAAEQAPTE